MSEGTPLSNGVPEDGPALDYEKLVTLEDHGVVGHRFRLPETDEPVVDVFYSQYPGHPQISRFHLSTHVLPPRSLKEAGPASRPKHTGGGLIASEALGKAYIQEELRAMAEEQAGEMFAWALGEN